MALTPRPLAITQMARIMFWKIALGMLKIDEISLCERELVEWLNSMVDSALLGRGF